MNEAPLCACGCGEVTALSQKSRKRRHLVIFNKFVNGHGTRISPEKRAVIVKRGYVMIYQQDHTQAHGDGYILEHVLIAEKVIGKILPDKAEVHHIDGDGTNNKNSNLVVCQDHGYHMLLHQRQRALTACGNASWRKCPLCKEYGDPSSMVAVNGQGDFCHQACRNEFQNAQYRKRKIK
jgi:HNH endonuclease